MRLPAYGDEVRLLNGTYVKVQQYLYTERDVIERTGDTIQRRHRVLLVNTKFVFVAALKNDHLESWVQLASHLPDDVENLYNDGIGPGGVSTHKIRAGQITVDKLSALDVGTAIHKRMTLDEEMLMLQQRIALTKKGRMIGIIMLAASAGAFIELVILTLLGVFK